MKTLHNQKGFTEVVSMLIIVTVIGFLVLQGAKWAVNQKIARAGKPFYDHIIMVKQQIDAYQADKVTTGDAINGPFVFPDRWSDLQPSYLADCSTTDNQAGRCAKPEQTPWGSIMTLRKQKVPGENFYQNIITIPLPPTNNPAYAQERQVHISALSHLAGMRFDEPNNQIIFTINRIGQELRHQALVRRSGDNSTLLGDWDVGGDFAITNAKDVTVRNSNGSQRRLGSGVVQVLTAIHNTKIPKHYCPKGLKPRVSTAFKGIFSGTEGGDNQTQSISEIRSYFTESTRFWTIGLDYYANIGTQQVLKHDGEVEVSLLCSIK